MQTVMQAILPDNAPFASPTIAPVSGDGHQVRKGGFYWFGTIRYFSPVARLLKRAIMSGCNTCWSVMRAV